MIFRPLALPGAWLIEPESDADHRGYFSRGYCRDALEDHDLDPAVIRCDVVIGRQRGRVYGLYHRPPPGEVIFLRCVRGVVHAILVDPTPAAEEPAKPIGLTLSLDNRHALYVPASAACGFQILEDDSEVLLQMSELEAPDDEPRTLPWDDPALGISWPLPVR